MPDINFLTIFHDYSDKSTLIKMADEIVELWGFPCIIRKWEGKQTALDSLYQDVSPLDEENEDLFDFKNTFVLVDYERFDRVLNSFGLGMVENTSIESMMKLSDKPTEDDIIEILYPYDNKKYRFKIGSADIHKDICYRVVLDIYHSNFVD